MRRILLAIVVAVLAVPSWAGITYTAVTRRILGSKASNGDFRVQGWISGKQARMVFLQSELPELGSGSYLVSADGGETVYLVNPTDKTYERWDVAGMVSSMADMMRNMRGEMKVRFEEPTVEKLLEEDGPKMQGMPTRHFRYRTSYKATIEMFEKQTIETVMEEDVWTTTAISEPGVSVFLNRRASSGDEQLDHILTQEMNKVPGFPLKRVTSTTQQTNKQTTQSRSEMEIVELKNVVIPTSMFKVPRGYTEMNPDDSELDKAMKKLERKNHPDATPAPKKQVAPKTGTTI